MTVVMHTNTALVEHEAYVAVKMDDCVVETLEDTPNGEPAKREGSVPSSHTPHPQGRPTPENSAGPNRESRRGAGVFSCGHASDGETSAGVNPDHASSPRRLGAGETSAARSDSLAPPWMGHGATARRSFRPRARNNSFTKAFAEARTNSDGTDVWEGSGTRATATETGTTQPLDSTNRVPAGVVAPTPLRHVVGVAGVPVASRTDTPPPPLPFAVTNTTAAGTTPGSPGAGAAAACTLLALLMTAGAKGGAEGDVSQAVTAAPTSCLGTGTSTGTTGNPRKRPFGTCVSGVQPGPDTDAAVDTASAPRLKKTKTKTAASKFVPAPQRAAHHDTDTNEPYHGPDIVPNTVMYNAASCAAAKRRLLPSRGGGTQKVHRPWTPLEVEALVEGVSHYGRGQWADIKSLTKLGVNKALELRSAVDLKDKWRNILRIAMLPVLYKRREAAEVPFGTLQRVREIAAAKHPQPGGCGNAGAGAAAASDADCDSANPVSQPTLTKGQRRSKHHSPWTLGESEALVDGVSRCGGCRWTVIKKLDLVRLEKRTAMDLKDKWRNLLQLASLPSQSRRKAETPPDLLQKVLRLEAEFGVARRAGRKMSDAPTRAAATA